MLNEKGCMAVLKAECDYYERLISQYEAELEDLPIGHLCCEQIRGHSRYYHRDHSGKNKYISASDSLLLGQLTRKRFLCKSLPLLKGKIKMLSAFLSRYRSYCPSDIYRGMPEFYTGLCKQYNLHINDTTWACEKFRSNPSWPEHLIHVTARGELVRSKSEAIIAGVLYSFDLPYRYEALLRLGDTDVYPDFTIRRPIDGKIFYLEHFGMLDNEEYRFKADKKLLFYKQYGILPCKNLLITSDDEGGSIDIREIQDVVKGYLLR